MSMVEFLAKYGGQCCEKGIWEGQQYDTFEDWWNDTSNGDFMEYTVKIKHGDWFFPAEAFIGEVPGSCRRHHGRYLVAFDISADWMREHIKCPFI